MCLCLCVGPSAESVLHSVWQVQGPVSGWRIDMEFCRLHDRAKLVLADGPCTAHCSCNSLLYSTDSHHEAFEAGIFLQWQNLNLLWTFVFKRFLLWMNSVIYLHDSLVIVTLKVLWYMLIVVISQTWIGYHYYYTRWRGSRSWEVQG